MALARPCGRLHAAFGRQFARQGAAGGGLQELQGAIEVGLADAVGADEYRQAAGRKADRAQGPVVGGVNLADDHVARVSILPTQRTRWPSVAAVSGGGAARHLGSAYLQRGAKLQAAGGSARSGGAPGIASRRWPRMPPWTVEASRPRVQGCRGASTICSTPPSSTSLPAYIAPIRSETSTATPISWVTKITPRSSSRCSSLI